MNMLRSCTRAEPVLQLKGFRGLTSERQPLGWSSLVRGKHNRILVKSFCICDLRMLLGECMKPNAYCSWTALVPFHVACNRRVYICCPHSGNRRTLQVSQQCRFQWGSAELSWAAHMSEVKPCFCISLDLAFRKLLFTLCRSTSSTWAASLLFLTELFRASAAVWLGHLAGIPLIYAFRSLDGTQVNLYSRPPQDKGFLTPLRTPQEWYWCEGYGIFLLWTSSGPSPAS